MRLDRKHRQMLLGNIEFVHVALGQKRIDIQQAAALLIAFGKDFHPVQALFNLLEVIHVVFYVKC